MKSNITDYDRFQGSSGRARRLLSEEELILEVTEALTAALDRSNVSKTELAHRLGKTKGFVSQVLAGGRNLTLRTVADVADAIGQCVRVTVCDRGEWIQKNLDSMESEVWTWRVEDRPRFRVVKPVGIHAEAFSRPEAVA